LSFETDVIVQIEIWQLCSCGKERGCES